jgi:glycosyltransferase involved in cell wall biosynthesis
VVKLFVPHFDKYFPRGVISEDLPIEVEILEFDQKTFNREQLPQRFKERLNRFNPDLVFVGDGYYLKPLLVNDLGRDFRVILRVYSHELLCFRNSMYLVFDLKKGVWNPFQKGGCDNHLLRDPQRCYDCFISGWKLPVVKGLVGSGLSLRLLHYPHEYLAARAYDQSYAEEVRECFTRVSDIIVYNQFMADLLSPFHHNIHIIPSGVDEQRFDCPPLENIREIKNILMPGRVTDTLKGFGLLLAASKMLYRSRQDFRVLITLPHARRGLPTYVENVGWWRQDDLPGLYHKADIVVAPALWQEPFGIIPLEAMSCRKPVVASGSGGHLLTVVDGKTGLLFRPGDVEDLATKLSVLLDSGTMRTQMGEMGRERVLKHFSWDVIMEKHYQRILKRKM